MQEQRKNMLIKRAKFSGASRLSRVTDSRKSAARPDIYSIDCDICGIRSPKYNVLRLDIYGYSCSTGNVEID
uniref:Uncharacterized protein n=1 Tax=Romanomermis culicivorax TaxID=13658 RepID=A0A915I0Y5_ROMCU